MIVGIVSMSISSFIFWILAARLTTPEAVGAASALFTAMFLLAQFSNPGLSVAVSRFAGRETRTHAQLYLLSMLVVTAFSGLVAAIFVLVSPDKLIGPLIGDGKVLGWLVLWGLVATLDISAITDVRLMGRQEWRLVFVRHMVISIVRLPLVMLVPSSDSGLWLFVITAGAFALTGLPFVPAMLRTGGDRVALRPLPPETEPAARYAGVNWAGQLLVQAPFFGGPLVVLLTVGVGDFAAFYLAWATMSIAFISVDTIGRTMLVVASTQEADRVQRIKTALALGMGVAVPCAIGSMLVGDWLVRLYGPDFSELASLLPPLMFGVIPWVVIAVALADARHRTSTPDTLKIATAFALGVLAGLTLGARISLLGAAWGWVIGMTVAAVASSLHMRQPDPVVRLVPSPL